MILTSDNRLKKLLDERALRYEHPDFVMSDPVQIPHRFGSKEDIEISAFLTATISWGQRAAIIRNAHRMMDKMDGEPYRFVTEGERSDWRQLEGFVHRTFNSSDLLFFIESLKNIYLHHGGLENVFTQGYQTDGTICGALACFRAVFLEPYHEKRVEKHVSDVTNNSAAKRLNMFLRWMVRSERRGVDFGLWKQIPASVLELPLDVHTGDVARAYGLLTRRQNDRKALEQVMQVLRAFDPEDPVKYDYALFGIGMYEL
jgi:uncharacterized protein (TIGR02757 family)